MRKRRDVDYTVDTRHGMAGPLHCWAADEMIKDHEFVEHSETSDRIFSPIDGLR